MMLSERGKRRGNGIRFAPTAILMLAVVGNVSAAEAPTVRPLAEALGDASVGEALERIDGRAATMAAELAAIGAIQSPSGREHERAAAVAERMRALGLSDVTLDDSAPRRRRKEAVMAN